MIRSIMKVGITLIMGETIEPRHSLSRTRMLSINPMYVKTRSD